MLVVGLTGSIGMGKSTVAARLRALGIAVCDADAEVHKLYEGAAVPPIEAAFPGTTAAGKVDRQKLAAALLAEPARFKRLEAIVHPLVFEAERAFLRAEAAKGAAHGGARDAAAAGDGRRERVDAVIVVSAPARGPAPARHAAARHDARRSSSRCWRGRCRMPRSARRADFVVDTGGTFAETDAQVDRDGRIARRPAGHGLRQVLGVTFCPPLALRGGVGVRGSRDVGAWTCPSP